MLPVNDIEPFDPVTSGHHGKTQGHGFDDLCLHASAGNNGGDNCWECSKALSQIDYIAMELHPRGSQLGLNVKRGIAQYVQSQVFHPIRGRER